MKSFHWEGDDRKPQRFLPCDSMAYPWNSGCEREPTLRSPLHPRSDFGLLVLCCVLACALLFCTHKDPPPVAQTPVVLISIDTLRSDHLPAYGYAQLETPAIDALARDAIVYKKAFSHVPLTLPSHATLMTGLLPAHLGVRDNTSFYLPEQAITLAERFREHGFQTAGVVSSMVLRRATGIDQGFDFFDDQIAKGDNPFVNTYAYRKGDQSLEIVRRWLDGPCVTSKPFFLFFHLFDPHAPYEPPEPYASRYASAYDGEIAFTDSLLATFFQDLKERGIYDRALIILTADHGEGLGDHIELEHGMFLYREALQVPLMIKLPGQERSGTVIESPVGLYDLAPTIAGLMGFEAWDVDGISILDRNAIPEKRPILSETLFAELHYGWYRQTSAIQGRLHYLEGFEPQLFDMEIDPFERDDLYARQEVPGDLKDALASLEDGDRHTMEISQDELDQLASLGYVGTLQVSDDIKALRPEEMISLKIRFRECLRLLDLGQSEKVETELVALLEDFPTMLDARALLASVLRPQHRYEDIDALLTEGLSLYPDDVRVLTYLAEARFHLDDPEAGISLTRRAMRQDPVFAGKILLPPVFRLGNDALATGLAEKMVAQEHHAYAAYVLGELHAKHGEFDRAVVRFKEAQSWLIPEESSLSQALSAALGHAYLESGQTEQARTVLQEALERDPKDASARLMLASLLGEGDAGREAQLLEEGLRYDANQLDVLLELIETKLELGDEADASQWARKAIAQSPHQSAGPVCYLFLSRASTEAAAAIARHVLQVAPHSPYACHTLGRIAHARQDYGDAIDWFEKTKEVLPQGKDDRLLAETCFYLGDAYANQKQADQAVRNFSRAIQARPDYPEAQVSLAALFLLLGHEDRARQTLDRWLTAFPSEDNHRRMQQLLAQFGLREFYDRYARSGP